MSHRRLPSPPRARVRTNIPRLALAVLLAHAVPLALAAGAVSGRADAAPPASPAGTAAAPGAVRAAAIRAGDWRVVLDHPGGGLPFTLALDTGPTPRAWFVNGAERVAAEEVRLVDGRRLEIRFPSYASSLTAELQPDGTLVGKVVLTRRQRLVEFPLRATHGESWRFSADVPSTAPDLQGTWAATLGTVDGRIRRPGVAVFRQKGHVVEGTFAFPQGDYRFLAGEIRDGELKLSTFDGGQGSLWIGRLAKDGTLSGTFYSGSYGLEPLAWTAKRDAGARLEGADTMTYLKPGYERLEFTFPDVDGRPVSLADERFRDKVVIVSLGGSWCPTCHDEAAFLAPWYRDNRARGVEVIGLQYEYEDDFAKAAQAVRAFNRRWGVEYPTLIAGTSEQDKASATLPMINAVLVYPTLIFIDRTGKVRRIHTGFPGPATGDLHAAFKADFVAYVDGLLAEP